jgi:hypothetical protein
VAAEVIERMAADVEAEQLFFEVQDLGGGPGCDGDGLGFRATPLRPPCRDLRSFCSDAALESAWSMRANMAARSSFVKSKAPAFTRDSKVFLFTDLVSMREQKSSRLLKSPFLRSSMAAAMAASPTFLMAARP